MNEEIIPSWDKWDEGTLAYTAGFLDGEGSFIISSAGQASVQISNTYKPVLIWLRENFGGSIYNRNQKRSQFKSTKPCYEWRLYGYKAAELAEAVLPFLKEKNVKATNLIKHQKTKIFKKQKEGVDYT